MKRKERDNHKVLIQYLSRRIILLESVQEKTAGDLTDAKESMLVARAVFSTLQDEVDEHRESLGRCLAVNQEVEGNSDDDYWDPAVVASSQVDPDEAQYKPTGRKR